MSVFPHDRLRSVPRAHRDAADPVSLVHAIHERRMKAGVAISPDTPSTSISDEVGELADLLLVMTVYPGEFFSLSHPDTERNVFRPRRTEVYRALRSQGRRTPRTIS